MSCSRRPHKGRIRIDHERVRVLAHNPGKCRLDVCLSLDFDDLDSRRDRGCGLRHVFHVPLDTWIVGVDENGNNRRFWRDLPQEPEPLCAERARDHTHPGQVTCVYRKPRPY